MNIVITLPSELASLIYKGIKKVEIRKVFPNFFYMHENVVYICEKGTGVVTGMFTIESLHVHKNPDLVWQIYSSQIGVTRERWQAYTDRPLSIHVWHIKSAMRFLHDYPLVEYFGLKVAPQSFAYTDTKLFMGYEYAICNSRRTASAVR